MSRSKLDLRRNLTWLKQMSGSNLEQKKGNSLPFVPIAMFREESEIAFALTCAFVIAPSEKAVDADRNTAAYRTFGFTVAKKIV